MNNINELLDELPSLKHQYEEMKAMTLFKIFLKKEDKSNLKKIKNDFEDLMLEVCDYNKNFSDKGWILYDTINMDLVKTANSIYKDNGIEEAERYLIKYYTNDIKDMTKYLIYTSSEFRIRENLINKALDDHFNKRYHASVPLFLTIVDGIINDFTKNKGFFSEGIDVDCWDCLVGCGSGIKKIKDIYNSSRKKTNTDEIYFPYRNGILHGRDLNYDNQYVSSKCVVMLFAISDWIGKKSTEKNRQEKLNEELNPPPLLESINKLNKIQKQKKIINNWKPQTIVVGEDIPVNGKSEDYKKYEYLYEFIIMLEFWKNKNYGELSKKLNILFMSESNEKLRPKICRELFEKNILKEYKIIQVIDQAICMKVIKIEVVIQKFENEIKEEMQFGIVYEGNNICVLPGDQDGEWIIYPQDVRVLYS